jgi:hypothetical protein
VERPTKQELLGAIRGFLEKELMPELEGVRRFHVRVSVNALAIVLRELELEGEQRPAQHARLCALLGRTDAAPAEQRALDQAVETLERELCARIRDGFGDEPEARARLLVHLRASSAERLAVSNPGYR